MCFVELTEEKQHDCEGERQEEEETQSEETQYEDL